MAIINTKFPQNGKLKNQQTSNTNDFLKRQARLREKVRARDRVTHIRNQPHTNMGGVRHKFSCSTCMIHFVCILYVCVCLWRYPHVLSMFHQLSQGELLLKRLILQFRRSYRRSDKATCLGVCKFIAHLVNQQVAHEVSILCLF